MSTFQLKEHLKLKIDQTNDVNLLAQITAILENKSESIVLLSNEQKISIKKSQTEYLEGNYFSNHEVNEEMEKWLKE